MNNAFKKIGLIGKYGDPSVSDTLLRLNELLLKHDCEVVLESDTAKSIADHDFKTAHLQEIGDMCDMAITVGGDGTLLHAARSLANHEIALLGVNLGRLGFLVDISPDQMQQRMEEIDRHLGSLIERRRAMGDAAAVLAIQQFRNEMGVPKEGDKVATIEGGKFATIEDITA